MILTSCSVSGDPTADSESIATEIQKVIPRVDEADAKPQAAPGVERMPEEHKAKVAELFPESAAIENPFEEPTVVIVTEPPIIILPEKELVPKVDEIIQPPKVEVPAKVRILNPIAWHYCQGYRSDMNRELIFKFRTYDDGSRNVEMIYQSRNGAEVLGTTNFDEVKGQRGFEMGVPKGMEELAPNSSKIYIGMPWYHPLPGDLRFPDYITTMTFGYYVPSDIRPDTLKFVSQTTIGRVTCNFKGSVF